MPNEKLAKGTALASDPHLQAPAILTIGLLLWRLLSAISNIDFLLSINEEKFALIFAFMQNTGWWLFSIIGLCWFWIEWSRRKSEADVSSKPPGPGMVIACSVVAFLFGILLAVRSTGSVPNIVTSWGGPPGACTATFDTTRLISFASRYKIALACGIQDANTDKLEDANITFSKPFTIAAGGLAIVAPYRPAMIDHLQKMGDAAKGVITGSLPNQPTNVAVQIQVWHDPVLVPNEVTLEKVATLAELMRLGGKVLRPQYFH
jgi:hypothetical protein